jgi:plasmid replication DNA-binding protein KfrA
VDQSTVNEAVRALRSRGERISVRAVRDEIGEGSHRELTPMVRNAREFLTDDEAAALEEEASEPVAKPSLGEIVEAFMASQEADREAGEASAILDEKREQLRDLVSHRPPPALVLKEMAASVDARFEHDVQVARLQEEISQLQGMVAERQAVARTWRVERNKLQRQAEELASITIPETRRRLIAAGENLSVLERDTAHQLMLARRHQEGLRQALADYEAKLRNLRGE